MSTRCSYTLLIAFFLAPVLHAQSWYVSGTKSCMDFGTGISECFTQGFVQQMSDSRPRGYEDVRHAYQAGQEAGEGFGTLVGVLIGLWIQHHQAVKAEANDLRGQIVSYHRAENELMDDQLQTAKEDERLCVQLSSLDSERSGHWRSGADSAREIQSTIERVHENMYGVEKMELQARTPKAIRELLDNPQHGVKKRQEIQKDWAFQLYLQHQFLVARVGMYSAQPPTAPASPPSPLAAIDTPAAVGTSATVTVERTTANAEIYLDGAFVGNTPAVLHVTSGNHVVRLKTGKDEWERTLAVSDGADLRLRPAF